MHPEETYTYDALHRLLTKTYSDGTDGVTYIYDQARSGGFTIANGKGRRTKMSDAAGSQIWSFDQMGRVDTSKRKTSNKTKIFTYDYYLDGSLKFILYPSGRRVDYKLSPAGRLITAKDVANGINYVTGTCPGGGACYAPQGALSSLKTGVTGSFAGYSRTWSYNERLQPKDIVATAPAPTGDIFSLNYQFDLGLANNGNVMQITNNLNSTRTQSFSYDQLNRIQTAGVPSDWGLSYAYDRYGNLLTRSVTQGSAPALSVAVNSSNQITNAGFSYDAAGNMTADGSGTYSYDAENRMTSTAGVDYTYDGDGRRVKKDNGTLYWYGVGGEVLMETNSGGNSPEEYIFFNGQRIARRKASGEVNYYFSDHLGSSRVVTNDAGQILDDADFYPFGGERPVTSSSGNNYKFTGQERDSESGLDYFIARYYASNLGRFLQPDPLFITKERMRDPQSLNLYAYVRNNPLKFVDPLGLELVIYVFYSKDLTDKQRKFLKENKEAIQQAIAAKFKEAGVENVEFRELGSLTQNQIEQTLKDDPTGVGFLSFTNESIGEMKAGSKKGGTSLDGVKSVVFLGNLIDSDTDSDTAVFRIGQVAAHELGHGQGFDSDGETLNFIKSLLGMGNLMGEGQGMPQRRRPKSFDATQDKTKRAIKEINRIGDNTPPKR